VPAGAHTLAPRWASLEELTAARALPGGRLRLDLGCGHVTPEGFIGLDDRSGEDAQHADGDHGPDVLLDLNAERYPFADGSCAEIRASHFLEHSNLPHVFDEVARLLAPGGVFYFKVPYANSAEGMFPGHQIFLTERFFEQNLQFQRLFAIDRLQYTPSDVWRELPWVVRRLLPFDVARKVLFNVCWEMSVWASPRAGG
jgi:SAM-dependent methyltransferase